MSIRNARVAIQVIGHLPAPILLSVYQHSWPSVYPHVVFPDIFFTNITSNYAITAFMATPCLITRVCSQAPVRMEVPARKRATTFPVRIKITPIIWSCLKVKEENLFHIDRIFIIENYLKLNLAGQYWILMVGIQW